MHNIGCAQIWGGIHSANLAACTSGVTASIYSQACDGQEGGDIYYFSVCSKDILTRVAIADLRGHGSQVAQLGRTLYDSLESHMNSLDSAAVLRDLNVDVAQHGHQAMTTAAVFAYRNDEEKVFVSYAGHSPVLVRRRGRSEWEPLAVPDSRRGANLPLGVFGATHYDQAEFALECGDRFCLYTDGVLECASPDGEEFGLDRLQQALSRCVPTASLEDVKDSVIRELVQFSGGDLTHDDVTLLVGEIHSSRLPATLPER